MLASYYGCGLVCPGLVCPLLLEGCRVLDLGCGSGRDVYVLAQLVRPQGEVIGVDMTDEQLAVAQKHQAHHAEVFGFDNVRFLKSYIERLDGPDLAPGSFDVIVSNCVVDFSPDKPAVLRGVERLLKSGGGLNFSDVFADRRRQATQGRAGGLHAQAADHAQCHGPHTNRLAGPYRAHCHDMRG